MYSLYLAGVLCPVTPSKIKIKVKNQNRTLSLIDGSEINLLKKAGLSDIQFDLLLPQLQYPFAVYEDGFKPADYYLGLLEKLKQDQKPFRLIIYRALPSGDRLFDTGADDNFKVSLEDYQIDEDAKNGFDVTVSVKLKQYREFGTKTMQITEPANEGVPVVTVQSERSAYSAPHPQSYTVAAGDCLWNIAKRYLGDGDRYTEIWELNADKILNPNVIEPGQVLVMPL